MHSGKIALGGISAAVATVLLLLTAAPPATAALAALAGVAGIPLVVEINRRAALAQYAAVAILTLLLVPAWEGKVLYIGFFGWYAIAKSLIESRRLPRPAEWALKLALFAAALASGGALAVFVLSVPLPPWSPLLWAGAAVGALGVFLLYDIGLTQLISSYLRRWHTPVRRLFRF